MLGGGEDIAGMLGRRRSRVNWGDGQGGPSAVAKLVIARARQWALESGCFVDSPYN